MRAQELELDVPRRGTKPQLRGYQLDAIEALREGYRAGHRRGLLQAGTGAGKTVIASAIIDASQDKNSHAIFLAHRRELVFQASDKLNHWGVPHGILMAGEQPLARHVQVASIQTLDSWDRNDKLDLHAWPNLVIVDEAHRSASPTYTRWIDRFLAEHPRARVLGLTATPVRPNGSGLGDVYDFMVCCPSIRQLTAEGWLVPARFYAPTTPDLSQATVSAETGDYTEDSLGELMDTPELTGDIVENWARYAADRKTVVFASTVDHSIHLAQQYQAAGVRARHIDGNTPKSERDATLRALSKGDLQAVINCMVLTEGWDQPDVSCCVLARPTKSPVLYLQMVGRVLRPAEGKTDCLILDHAGAVFEHGFPEEFDDWHLTKGKNDRHPNPTQQKRRERECSPVTCPQCTGVYTGKPTCPYCGHVPERFGREIAVMEGELGEVGQDRIARERKQADDRESWMRQLLYVAEQKGYKRGWAFMKFREKFKGEEPPQVRSPEPVTPLVARWVQSRNIAYAKARAKAAARA